MERIAPEGRITVRPGIYHEGLVVEKPVSIIGEGPADQIVVECDATIASG